MLTASDKKYISKAIKGNNDILIKEVMGLFNVTNKRIDDVEDTLLERINLVERKLGRRIDEVLEKLKEHDVILFDHGKRLGRIEDKVFATTTDPL